MRARPVILMLTVGVIVGVAACGTPKPNAVYTDMFLLAATADGAYAEQLSGTLGREFRKDPLNFTGALAAEGQGTIEAVARLLAYDATYQSLEEYRVSLLKLRSSGLFASHELRVLEEMLDAVAQLEVGLSSTSPAPAVPPTIRPKAFDPDTILTLIRVRMGAGIHHDPDEEYSDVLGNAYCADPQLFAKTISVLPDDEVGLICRYVAHNVVKYGKRPGSPAPDGWELSAKEDQVLKLIQREITKAGGDE